MTIKTLSSVLVAALIAVCTSARAEDGLIQVALQDGKTRAQFRLGDSHCVLVDDEIRCTRSAK